MNVLQHLIAWNLYDRLQQCLSVFFNNYSVLSAENKVGYFDVADYLEYLFRHNSYQVIISHQNLTTVLTFIRCMLAWFRNVLQEPSFQWCELSGLEYMATKEWHPRWYLQRSEQHSYHGLCYSFCRILFFLLPQNSVVRGRMGKAILISFLMATTHLIQAKRDLL